MRAKNVSETKRALRGIPGRIGQFLKQRDLDNESCIRLKKGAAELKHGGYAYTTLKQVGPRLR